MPRQINEELTRKEMIDPQLEKAGWYLRDHSRVKIEIPVYAYNFLMSQYGQYIIQQKIRGTITKTITKNAVREFKILFPPLSLQEEFAGVVARVEGLRGRMSEAERQVEGLFEALLSESFGS
jgi:hypothetical protein